MSLPPLVFITGASSGIGQALAERYLEAGWRLALVARRGPALRQWAAERRLESPRCAVYEADVQQIDSIVAAGKACLALQGLPDVVIASAGVSVGWTACAVRPRRHARRAGHQHPGRGGDLPSVRGCHAGAWQRRLVGIASVSAIRGLPGHGAYCASKAGVVAYCESLRVECRAAGVKVVTLLPGYIATPLTARNTYKMPFLMTPQGFADRAFKSIAAGVSYRVIPWQMGVLAKLLRALPNGLYDRLIAGRGRKARHAEP